MFFSLNLLAVRRHILEDIRRREESDPMKLGKLTDPILPKTPKVSHYNLTMWKLCASEYMVVGSTAQLKHHKGENIYKYRKHGVGD